MRNRIVAQQKDVVFTLIIQTVEVRGKRDKRKEKGEGNMKVDINQMDIKEIKELIGDILHKHGPDIFTDVLEGYNLTIYEQR